jgi:cyclohexanecarboxyl-CoA dehydrogenase
MCVGAIQDCMVLHGHYGWMQDFPIEQRLRDVAGQIIADGTPQIQKLIIARELFGREFV